MAAVVTGGIAGMLIGFVLQRGDLCFHSMFAGAWSGDTRLLREWLFGVAVGAVGLAMLYATPWSDGLNRGLAFRPVANILGGLLIGVGMVVAQSCVSGLFYKLGSGMLGAVVGLGGWAAGELIGRQIHVGGPTVLDGGLPATLPGVLDVPRIAVAVLLLLAVLIWMRTIPKIGLALGLVLIAAWILARVGGSPFGPSSVGAVASVADGTPNRWLIAFLIGIIVGGFGSARSRGELVVRGESIGRLLGLAAGGVLLGIGGWIAGGCNLGHGLSGVAQLNVSSWVVVAAMAVGVEATRRVLKSSARIASR